ncbi:NAD(P)H-dependent glycerol-3-phosphate dehydrogenase [Chlamydiifrater volucris]|uniref:NAD(P)H-dependent glycerol-3-phosphate dehydrogenase n=1 Tax=Chlamydiifrater volucris TaxID=2681470 RepID=UPI001BCB9BB9|nr:NAD(P)H-dependent glycerol-3-phosphate dehydrogenase [Chlamydiifrater volucris]
MTQRIAYLGMGIWGYCLTVLLSKKGFQVTGWSRNPSLVEHLNTQRSHPKAPNVLVPDSVKFTTNLEEALHEADMIIEGVTSAGIRSLAKKIQAIKQLDVPFVITSKGIEQNTGLFLSEILLEEFGEKARPYIGYLSGPSIASEVLQGCPCSVVVSAYSTDTLTKIHSAFSTPKFRVYPNSDIKGVALGGALKNVIAIACGISDGFRFGDNAKSGLITRGLHEIRKCAALLGCRSDTINGLAGLGDLCVTCFSSFSRNYQFGKLIAEGIPIEKAKQQIGMVVEGSYTAVSAHQIAEHHRISMPITSGIYHVLYEGLDPAEGVALLMQRDTKEEYL